MNNIEISFDRPWLLLLAIPAFATILIPFLLLPRKRRCTLRKRVPVILHMMMVSILVLILSGLTFVKSIDNQAVMLLLDFSHSTTSLQEAIADHAEEILGAMDGKVPLGVIAFGGNQIYAVEMHGSNRKITAEELTATVPEIVTDATDINSALEYAVSLMPEDLNKRIILLSDGAETDRDALNYAQYLATQNVRIDAMYFDTTDSHLPEMQISTVSIPEGAYVGDDITITVELQSNVVNNAVLKLYDETRLLAEQEVAMMPGLFMTELSIPKITSGSHTYQLVLHPEQDTVSENNQGYAHIEVAGESSVLVIADTLKNAAFLDNILSDGNVVDTTTVFNAPDSILELCNYDEVILVNANYNGLPDGYDELLRTYVGVYGRSLLTVGGLNTYMFGNMQGTALEEMLPVSFTLEEETEGESVALMLVLDCSSSMNRQLLSVAKQGAIKCVEAMTDNDYVGVISFNTTARLRSEIIQATDDNKDLLTRTISGLTTGRGTYYVEALELAHEELNKATADKRHVIFLSDGEPTDRGYVQAVEAMAEDGITVSTIGLSHSSNSLSNMAESGSGRYYYVQTATDLPDIMVTETEQIVVSNNISGEFATIIAKDSHLTTGISAEDLPVLTGYIGTTIKEDATAYLVSEKDHPLYATWQYGEGTVAFFASDLYGEWSSRWMNNATAQTLVRSMVATTVSEVHKDSAFRVNVDLQGKTAEIAVHTPTINTGNQLTVTAVKGRDQKEYSLKQTDPDTYSGTIEITKTGVYQLMIVEEDTSGTVIDYTQIPLAVSYFSEYNAFTEAGQDLLENLCKTTDGIFTDNISEIVNSDFDSTKLIYNPLIPFGILMALLLLADIAVRKIRWKDIKHLFAKQGVR